MIGLIQRVKSSSVVVAGETVGEIDAGIMALIGIEKPDEFATAARLVDRILSYRIFEDSAGKMNLSLADINGGLLLVPQFTLAADTKKGSRPSFSCAMPPADAALLFTQLVEYAAKQHDDVETGRFGADMQVHLINDGPVTFSLQV